MEDDLDISLDKATKRAIKRYVNRIIEGDNTKIMIKSAINEGVRYYFGLVSEDGDWSFRAAVKNIDDIQDAIKKIKEPVNNYNDTIALLTVLVQQLTQSHQLHMQGIQNVYSEIQTIRNDMSSEEIEDKIRRLKQQEFELKCLMVSLETMLKDGKIVELTEAAKQVIESLNYLNP